MGNYVTFGTYMQGSSAEDKTPVEWRVLDVQGNKALLISRYGLEHRPYNNDPYREGVTWEECTLREWLNNNFLKMAFSAAEQMAILTSTVDNSQGQCFDFTMAGQNRWAEKTTGGNNTQDRIFLLSYAEANKYFGVRERDHSNVKARVQPTAYAIQSGAFTDRYKTSNGNEASPWWLRSPGKKQPNAALVKPDGALSDDSLFYGGVSVRPAFWINLECLENAGRQVPETKGNEGGNDYDSTGLTKEEEPSPAEAASRESCAVGRYVTFGTYPQTKAGDDSTPVEWLVLDVQDNKALLISRYVLDSVSMTHSSRYVLGSVSMTHSGTADIDRTWWEKNSTRKWLNNGFWNQAFSAAEQKAILTTMTDNSDSQGFSRWKTSGGNDTRDKLFLLSYAEANKYLGVTYTDDDNTKSRAVPTDYAVYRCSLLRISQEDYKFIKEGVHWWLRSPGSSYYGAAMILKNGNLGEGTAICLGFARPAMWIDLDGISESEPDKPTDAVAASKKSCAVAGNHVTFGNYLQSKAGTDTSPIEWLVLDVQDTKALLISRYGLEHRPYDNDPYREGVTWEECTLREWLNNNFLKRAFSAAEQMAILTSTVDNSQGQCFDFTTVNQFADKSAGGNNTQDKLFLLSCAEANKYFGVTYTDYDNMRARVQPTEYVKKSGKKGVWSTYTTTDGKLSWCWWSQVQICV